MGFGQPSDAELLSPMGSLHAARTGRRQPAAGSTALHCAAVGLASHLAKCASQPSEPCLHPHPACAACAGCRSFLQDSWSPWLRRCAIQLTVQLVLRQVTQPAQPVHGAEPFCKALGDLECTGSCAVQLIVQLLLWQVGGAASRHLSLPRASAQGQSQSSRGHRTADCPARTTATLRSSTTASALWQSLSSQGPRAAGCRVPITATPGISATASTPEQSLSSLAPRAAGCPVPTAVWLRSSATWGASASRGSLHLPVGCVSCLIFVPTCCLLTAGQLAEWERSLCEAPCPVSRVT